MVLIVIVNLNAFNVKFFAARYAQFAATTLRADWCKGRCGRNLVVAIPAGGSGRFSPEIEGCTLGRGIFAQYVEIKLYGVINNAGHIANNKIDGGNLRRAVVLGGFKGNVEYALGYR